MKVAINKVDVTNDQITAMVVALNVLNKASRMADGQI